MAIAVSGFDWDSGNRAKCQKHGVSIADIEAAFARPIAVLPDPLHSRVEERFKAIGATDHGRFVLIVFTLRRKGAALAIRPISARYMHRKEIDHYEKEIAKTQNR
jgi:hypothetical protein